MSKQNEDHPAQKSGLDIGLHPLLRGIKTSSNIKNPVRNPLKRKIRDTFDEAAINPYLDDASVPSRNKRTLQFNDKGKYISIAEKLRLEKKEEARLLQEQEIKKANGVVPDTIIGEQNYRISIPPQVEWWDKPYLANGNSYQSEYVYDNEDHPITKYIQHPVFVNPLENNDPNNEQLMLTTKERKKLRRNTRLIALKEKQDRIKLGLDAPPPPKVRLSNLMNVLTNEAIQDPTAVEMRVREELNERIKKHEQENEQRKLTKEQKHEKQHIKREKDLSKGCFCTVYRIETLQNKKHSFKVDINAKQLELVGVCLHNPKFALIIVEGGSKSINFYKKLLTKRIDWTIFPQEKDEEDNFDYGRNKCSVIWEGEIPDPRFQKWTVMYSRNDEEAISTLSKFHVENYWKEALLME